MVGSNTLTTRISRSGSCQSGVSALVEVVVTGALFGFVNTSEYAVVVAVTELVDYLALRREQCPGMHIYHYNHTERSALQRMAKSHRVAEAELAELVETWAFVDSYFWPITESGVGVIKGI